jgi:short-subunit dehydrogenase
MAPYSASKIAVEQFGSALRMEVAHKGVDVGVAHPSWIDTDLVRDQQRELSTFNQTLAGLPGPFGKVTPLAECVDALVDGMERRRRKVYVPKSLAPFAAIRQLFTSPLAERAAMKTAARRVPRLEAEILALGRAFGEHSVGNADVPEKPRPPSE